MTPDQPIGQIMTVADAEEFFTRCLRAEKAMGPLSRDEKLVILKSIGKAITQEDLTDLIAGKRVLQIGRKNNAH